MLRAFIRKLIAKFFERLLLPFRAAEQARRQAIGQILSESMARRFEARATRNMFLRSHMSVKHIAMMDEVERGWNNLLNQNRTIAEYYDRDG